MAVHTPPIAEPAPMRWLMATGVLLASAFALANDNNRLAAPPAYGDILSDDIYERAEGWREQPMIENEWRASKPEPKSRIKFGYDSAHEELRARDDDRYSSRSINLRDPKPANQFRLGF